MKQTTSPYPFQQEDILAIENYFEGRVILANQMGLGKTPTTLWWINGYMEPGAVVVVCPATIKENWRREAMLHTGMKAIVLDKMKPPKGMPRPNPKHSQVYIINYDILGDSRKKRGTWLRWLKRLNPKCVVMDECHYIKSTDARRTKACKELCKGVKHVLALSGTPLTNRPDELWSVLSIVVPDLFPSRWAYRFRYCGPKHNGFGWEFKGATRLKELHKILRETCMIRRLKSEVLKDLPPKTRDVVLVNVPDSRMAEYREAERDLIAWLMKTSASKARRAQNAEGISKISYLKHLCGQIKLNSIIKWVEDFLESTSEKLILFGVHKDVLGAVRERFSKVCTFVDGSVTGKKRQLAIDKFNNDKKCRLFIGNIQAAGVGWSCKSASAVAFAEMAWTPGEHTQAEDRIHGIGRGTGRRAAVYYLIGSGTFEETLCRILTNKQDVLDKTLDGRKMKGMDVMNQLEKALIRRGSQTTTSHPPKKKRRQTVSSGRRGSTATTIS